MGPRSRFFQAPSFENLPFGINIVSIASGSLSPSIYGAVALTTESVAFADTLAYLRVSQEQLTMIADSGFHYTSLESALSILESMTLRLSNIRACNDGNEFLHGVSVYRELAGDREGISTFKGIEDSSIPFWVYCFSRKGDDFSQWWLYGDSGGGACIEFDLEILAAVTSQRFGENSTSIQQVEYEPESQLAALKPHVDEMGAKQMCHPFNDICRLKQKAFSSEQEIRLLVFQKGYPEGFKFSGEKRRPRFRVSGNRIVPFIETEFPTECVKSVRLGPSANFPRNRTHFDQFLENYGFSFETCESAIRP